jgi:hypothetical protein
VSAGIEGGQFTPRRRDAGRVRSVGECDYAVGIADIERLADQRHAEGLIEPLHESLAHFGDAVALGVAQPGNAIRADAESGGALHRADHGVIEQAPDLAADGQRFGDKHVAIGHCLNPARMFQAARECVDRESRRGGGRLPGIPPSRRRHFQRRNALRLRRRNGRRGAESRRMRAFARSSPEDQRGADQRDDARKNSRQAHGVFSPRVQAVDALEFALT